MPWGHLYLADSFVEDHEGQIAAVVVMVGAFVLAEIVDRALKRQRLDLSPVSATRFRVLRRLIFSVIIVLGLAIALWLAFPGIQEVAAAVLASSAVLGLVVGFAARATLANAIAGIMLAISQPIRIGDLVTFDDQTGEVEDIRLTYTYIRCDDGRRLVIPNEKLAESPVYNHTVVDPQVQVSADIWVPHGVDIYRALELVSEDEGVEASVAEVTHEGIRLKATTWAETARQRGSVAARLRARGLNRLHEEGLSGEQPARPDVSRGLSSEIEAP